MAPSFLLDLLHEPSHALSGAVVFTLFAASALGQVTVARRFGQRSLAAGCVALIMGMALLAAGLAVTSLAAVIAAAVIAGLGQGLCMRAGLEAVNTQAPAQRRAGVASTFFIGYLGIALAAIGVGIAATPLGLRAAGIAACIVGAAIAAAALVPILLPARITSTPAALPVRA